MKRRIVLLGPPASGKGTQAELVAEACGIPTASTGAMLREERARGTTLGREVEQWTRVGKLFPDEVALRVLTQWLDGGRWEAFLLDGFPRTLGQAEAFDAVLVAKGGEVDRAVHLTLPEDEIRDRILNRVTCVRCGATYGMTFHKLQEGDACPVCAAKLERRSDDTLEALNRRLVEHREHTEPVLEYYRDRGVLAEIDATGDRATVFHAILDSLDAEVPR